MAKFKKGHKKVGGKKKGSKHKKTIEQELALEFLRSKVREKWEDLIDTKIELAKGIWAEKVVLQGKEKKLVKIYQELPDSNSLEYLFSMVVGKPKQSLELGVGESIGEVSITIKKNEDSKPTSDNSIPKEPGGVAEEDPPDPDKRRGNGIKQDSIPCTANGDDNAEGEGKADNDSQKVPASPEGDSDEGLSASSKGTGGV